MIYSQWIESQKGDILGLLHGAQREIVLRPCGENYRLVTPASCIGFSRDQLPMDGDEEGVQEITLI